MKTQSRYLGMIVLLLGLSCGKERQETVDLNGHDHSHYVRIPNTYLTPEFVKKYDFIRDHKSDDLFAFGYLSQASLELLPPAAKLELIELDISWSRLDFDAKTLEIKAEEHKADVYEEYHNYNALTNELKEIAAAHPDLVNLQSAGKSVKGRELWYVKISDNANEEEAEPKLLYIANMHGDETVGREMMVYLIRKLVNEYATNPRINALVNKAQIFIMPSMNPDGFELGQRFNANGVDLNRDFPDFSSDPNDTTSGRALETAAIMKLHAQHHFVMAINYHGGAVVFNLPWDTIPNQNPNSMFGDDRLISAAGRRYADANPAMKASNGGSFKNGVTYGYEWYEVDGGMQDWAIFYRNSIHATVELSNTKYPNASSLPGYWNQNIESMIGYLEAGIYGVGFYVIDPDQTVISNPVTVKHGRRTLTYPNGLINRPTLSGEQTLTIEASGFKPLTLNLPAGSLGENLSGYTLERKSAE